MGQLTSQAAARGGRTWALAVGAVALAAVVSGLAWGLEGRDAFWLDESWTGAVVDQPSWAESFRQIYWDVNAPLYYVLARAWSGLAGLSDAALRAPSLVCAALIGPAAALWPIPGLTRSQRLTWAAVLSLWFPALCFAQEARGYALLLLFATFATTAFARLLAQPTLHRAFTWAALTATAILVHYDAVYLGAAQGLIYLARWRTRAMRTWPAAFAFLPSFAWLAYHWPRIRLFTAPAVAWYAPLHRAQLPAIAAYLAGGPFQIDLFAALALSALSLRLVLPADAGAERAPPSHGRGAAGLAAIAALLAAAALVGVGFVKPSFTFRYLTPEAPGLMLGVVLLARLSAGRRAAPLTLAALATGVLASSVWMLADGRRMAPRRYNFETASRMIAAARPPRLVFLWDHPVDPVLEPAQLRALGGFFLHRAGQEVPVTPVVLHPGEDPNLRLAAEARPDGAAILWLYDTWVHGTAAVAHPPAPNRLAPRGQCRNLGGGRFGVLVCTRNSPGGA